MIWFVIWLIGGFVIELAIVALLAWKDEAFDGDIFIAMIVAFIFWPIAISIGIMAGLGYLFWKFVRSIRESYDREKK